MRAIATTILASLALVGACKSKPEGSPATRAQARQDPSAQSKQNQFRVTLHVPNDQAFVLSRQVGGYAVSRGDGRSTGKILVQPDRVKCQDTSGQTLAKAKKKPEGFRLYVTNDQGEETPVLRVKQRDGALRLIAPPEQDVGKIDADGSGSYQGETFAASRKDGLWQVLRNGKATGSVPERFSAPAAAFLSLTELSPQARLCAVLMADRVLR